MQETGVHSLGWEDPLEKERAPHSSTFAWKIPWTEEPRRLQSLGSQRVRHDWATSLKTNMRMEFGENIPRVLCVHIHPQRAPRPRSSPERSVSTLSLKCEPGFWHLTQALAVPSLDSFGQLSTSSYINSTEPIALLCRWRSEMLAVRCFVPCLAHSKCLIDESGRKVMTNLYSIFKSRDITLPTNVHLVRLWFFQWSCMDVRVGL